MATKVNIKFVIALSATLIILFGGVGFVAYQKLTTTGLEWESRGDALMTEGLFDEASNMYKNAHRKDPTNIGWLTKWRNALVQVVPETQVEYNKYYRVYYLGILGKLAALQEMDPAAQRAYLDPWHKQLTVFGAGPESWQKFIELSTTLIDRLPEDDPAVQSLHRYRGLALLKQMDQIQARTEDRANTLSDLQTALLGDPDDVEVAVGVIQWRFNEWLRAYRERRSETADQRWIELGREVIAVKEQFPENPSVLIKEIQIALRRVFQLETNPGARVRMIQNMRGAEQPLLDAIAKADPATLDTQFLTSTYAALKMLRPTDYADVMLPIYDRMLKKFPTDPETMLLRADALSDINRFEDSLAQLDEVVTMPNLPVSLKGMLLAGEYRINALYREGESVLELYDVESSQERKDELLEQAKGFREALVDQIVGGANTPVVMLLDGRIAMAEGRSGDAIERLKALEDQSGGNSEQVVELLGRALLQENLLGAARKQYERLVSMNPGNVRGLFTLAEIERRLRDLDAEAEHLQQILAIAPNLTEASIRLAANRAEQGMTTMISSTDADPVRIALIRWRALMQQDIPEPDEALDILNEARSQHGDDSRLLNALIIHYDQEGDATSALEFAEKAIALYPADTRFSDWKRRLELQSTDLTIDGRLALVDESRADPIAKMISKIRLLRSAGRDAEADELFDQAKQRAPDNSAVVELRFSRALIDRDFAEARSIASDAARLNLDSVNGALFQGRLEFAQGHMDSALATLQQVVERLPYNPLAQRLLGQTYLQLGRTNDSIDAFRRAFESKPDGLYVARMYVRALATLQRYDAALKTVKEARKFNGSDPILTDLWLGLEELVGDRSLVLAERRNRYSPDPDKFFAPNAIAWVRMMLQDKSWDQARKIIDESRSIAPQDAGLARLESDWYATQGKIEEGADVLRAFTGDTDKATPLLRLSRYLTDYGQFDEATVILKEAMTLETADQKIAELMLADLYYSQENYELAVPLYRAGIAGNADNESRHIARRLAETLLKLERYDESRELLLSFEGDARTDIKTNVLLAKISNGLGDRRGANRYLDAAVAAAPNDSAAFIQRAQFNADDKALLDDVLEDLNQAIRLAPRAIAPRTIKAAVLVRNGRGPEAVRELQSAVDTNPDLKELHQALIDQLISMKQEDQALIATDNAIATFPNDSNWLLIAGVLHARAERWALSEVSYRAAYELDPTPRVAVRLAQSLLQIDPPKPEEAMELLNNHTNQDELLSTVYLLQAQAAAELEDTGLARSLLTQSFNVTTTHADLRDWFNGSIRVYPDRIDLLSFYRELKPKDNLQTLFSVMTMRLEAQDPANQNAVIEHLANTPPDPEDVNTTLDLYRLQGNLLYVKQDYAKSAEIYRKAIKLAPNDLEFNNNLAYLLARNLNQPQSALEPAEKAAFLAPADSNVLDTLGWVYFRIGKYSQAQASLNRAISNADGPAEKLPAYIHLAETLIAERQFDRARQNLDEAQEILKRNPILTSQFGEELEKVINALDQAE